MATIYAKDQPAGFKNRIEKVAIVGATGSVGSYITKALVATNKHSITAITRTGSDVSSLPASIAVARIDYDDPSTIVAALRGHDMLIITLSVSAPKGTHDRLVQAAFDAGVPWVMPNEFGIGTRTPATMEAIVGAAKKADHDFIESLNHSAATGTAQPAAISWVSVVSGFWYEFSLAGSPHRFGFDIAGGKRALTLFDQGTARMSVSTWPRVAEATAALLSLPVLPLDAADASVTLSRWRNKEVEVQSLAVSQRDMWASLQRVLDAPEDKWTVATEEAEARYAAGKAAMMKGDRAGFSRAMYTRMFYPEEPALWSGEDSRTLGLKDEEIDDCTRGALKLLADGAFDKTYG